MSKLQSIIGEPGQVSIERVPLLKKPIAHQDSCGYVEHQLACDKPTGPSKLCNCLDQCSCGSMTEAEIHEWLDILRPSRVAMAAAAAATGNRQRASKKDWDAEF